MPNRRAVVLCAAVVALAAVPKADAQMSLIGGATFSELRGVDDANLDRRTGAFGGLSFVAPFGRGTFALQPELLVVSKGANAPRNSGNGLRLNYLEVPVMLRLSLAPESVLRPHLYAGPYLGLRISCDVSGSSQSCDDVPDLNANEVDVGGIVGGGVMLALGGLNATVGGRYGFGVSRVADFRVNNVRESARNGTFALYVGLGFGR
ncbi:MAG: PorT family protein [Gemmatimonadaceae bacterium]|jgi:hypothetical protein|nr:PorT family protein [Gemmatimonadaceae bacterium]